MFGSSSTLASSSLSIEGRELVKEDGDHDREGNGTEPKLSEEREELHRLDTGSSGHR